MPAPTYDLNSSAGRSLLNMTLNAGNSGQLAFGSNAFLGNDYQPIGSRGNGSEGWDPTNVQYNIDPLLALGDKMGYTGDASKLRGLSGGGPVFNPDGSITPATKGYDNNTYDAYSLYKNGLDQYLKDYVNVSGMSSGWDGTTGDPRSAASTVYKNQDNVLTPYSDPTLYHARERGSWAQENQDGVMAALILGGGFLGGSALAAAGAGGGAGAAAGATAAEGAGATGATAAGGAGAGTGGLSGTLSGLQGWYAGLPSYAQGALSGAAQGGLSSGLQGKNILQGALTGGLTGGLGAWGGAALAGATGMPAWAAKGIVSAGTGALGAGLSGGDWQRGALAGGLGSLAGSGLSGAGVNPTLAGKLGGMAGNYGAGAILGGAGGGSGGGGSQIGASGAPSSGVQAGTGMSGGVGGPQLGAAQAQEQAWLRTAYAPIAQEAAKKKLAKRVLDELDDQTA